MTLLLSLVALACVAIAALVWRRRATPGVMPLIVLLLAVAEWNLAYGLEIAADDLAGKLFWSKASYFGIVSIPLAIYAFAADYTGRRSWLRWRRMGLLAVIPTITLVLALTHEHHRLVWSSVKWAGADRPLVLEHGPGFYPGWVFTYLVLFAASVLLVSAGLSSRRYFQRQLVIVFIAMGAPWAGNLAYVLGLAPNDFDVTTIGFALTGIVLAVACVRWQLLELAPVARNMLVEHMRDGMVVLDGHGRVVDCNAAMQALITCSTDEAIGRHADEVLPAALSELWSDEGDPGRRPEGTVIKFRGPLCSGTYEAQMVELPGPAAGYGRLLLFHDVTAREVLQARLTDQALTDDLTKVGNRRHFLEQAQRALIGASRRDEPVAVIFVDIDHFKAINDTYGHACGDAILIACARRLEESIRPQDSVARLGGDEFAVLLGGVADDAAAEEVRERLDATLRRPIAVAGGVHVISASVGLHVAEAHGETPESLLHEADRKMYAAKRSVRSASRKTAASE